MSSDSETSLVADADASFASRVWALPRTLAIGLVRVYQLTLSPLLGPTCRFHPSCSHYACACLRDHGLLRGGWLTVRRLGRCHPFHPGGFDPPPPARERVDPASGVERMVMPWRT